MPDPVMSGERGATGVEHRISVDLFFNGSLQSLDFARDGREEALEDALCDRLLQVFAVVVELGGGGDKEIAQGAEFSQGPAHRVRSRRGLWLHGIAIVSEHAGIERIGLGKPALCACKVADLARVDHGDGNLPLLKVMHELAFITAGGFKDHPGTLWKQRAELSKTGWRIGQRMDPVKD